MSSVTEQLVWMDIRRKWKRDPNGKIHRVNTEKARKLYITWNILAKDEKDSSKHRNR